MRFCLAMLVLTVGCTGGDDESDYDGDGVTAQTDCDDSNPNAFPGNAEVCDGVDNDCNDVVDDDASDALTWFSDTDSDGYGDPETTILACTQPAGASDNSEDCDDSDWLVNPGATEACDLIDNDCNDVIDDAADGDGDGVGSCDDCDDTDPAIYRGAEEICDEIDNDCDDEIDEYATGQETWYADGDGDGHGDADVSVDACAQPTDHVALDDDCDDADATTYTGAPELCDGLDNNCDTVADEGNDVDGDGYDDVCGEDCDDDNAAANPGASEVCDGVDNNCSGSADDSAVDAVQYFADSDADSYGDTDTSVWSCEQPSDYVTDDQDCNDADAAINPAATETCDDVDQDCDDDIDEGLFSTWYADTDGDGFGEASDASEFCADPGSGYANNGGDCDDGDSAINPDGTEVCDGAEDEDCDGDVDEGLTSTWYADSDGDGYGDSDSASEQCSDPGTGYASNSDDCDDGNASAYPTASETCDGVDEDCDGTADNGLPSVTYYTDGDGDSYGDSTSSTVACSDPGSGYATDGGDCNDSDATINPDATETCDGVDEDCDGTADNGLATTTYYTDGDGDSYGEDGTDTESCSDPGSGYATADGDCDDGDSAVSPDAAEVCNDWVDNDCDDTDNGCTPTGGISAASADALIYAVSASGDGELGYSVFASDDYTGDGVDDVILGAPWDDAGGTEGGAAYVFSNPSGSMDTTDADAALLPTGGGDLAGRGAAIGDLDGDGSSDVAVGAYGANAVYIYSGAPGSSTPSVDALIAHTGSVNFGIAVAIGDLDDDGQDDLIVGASGYDGSFTDNGAAYVYYGPVSGTLDETDADAILEGTGGGDQAGGMLAFVGDVVGSGSDTLAIGARYNDDNGGDAGAIYLATGTWSGTNSLSGTDAVLTGAVADDNLWDGHGIGDVNGDGTDDFVAGAFKYDSTSYANAGGAFILYGPVSSGSVSGADVTISGELNGNGMGLALDGAGDFNGDGEADLVTGAYGNDDASNNAGAAYVFFGPLSSHADATTADLVIDGETAEGQLGWSVAGGFDSNDDGYDDVIACARKEKSTATDGGACYVVWGGGI